ncbi:MAG: hypothetical protein CBE11_02445 [Rickettsiales bacterium TMED251]|nr:MAG: hypothetical protein CBE11_02445 [Rickettsiales bacterium TMED251]|tara:strand:- start:1428 stop:2408 length:981 start_codon:yes stop_codon:yes gene_type:complete
MMLKATLSFFMYIFFLAFSSIAQIPNIEDRDKKKIKEGIVETYLRSMSKWDIPFDDLLENKSGAACIQWNKITNIFLENGMFDALGYSQNIPNKKASQIAAISGCKKMKTYYKLGDTCKCEIVVTNNENEVLLPIKEFNVEKEFSEAVKLYKKEDYQASYKKFVKLSNMGDEKSQYNLSVLMFKGRGLPQSFKKSYYWSLSSKLYGEKKADSIIKKSILKLSEEEVREVNEELKLNLETIATNGSLHALVPLAKWYIMVPKKPDYQNSYKWLSIASAFNVENTKRARDEIFKNLKKKSISAIQVEANDVYEVIVKNKEATIKEGEE